MDDSFEDRVFRNLRVEFPDLNEDFIRRHPRDLMDILALRDSAADTIDGRARQIPDYLPQLLNLSPAPEQSTQPDSVDKAGTSEHYCMLVLNMIMQKVLAGETKGLCVMSLRTDGKYDMLYTQPCNILAFYGFMTYAMSLAVQGGYEQSPEA